jgi:hypothetical protein
MKFVSFILCFMQHIRPTPGLSTGKMHYQHGKLSHFRSSVFSGSVLKCLVKRFPRMLSWQIKRRAVTLCSTQGWLQQSIDSTTIAPATAKHKISPSTTYTIMAWRTANIMTGNAFKIVAKIKFRVIANRIKEKLPNVTRTETTTKPRRLHAI